ncbi:type I restriction enzyme HsdR N-terminal domain-containing protein [Stutzerimonas balearica]|uniref:type I restriction enzyme HsdR N-terminal domain-containing protein n=1 Tax=Stutzerimonas balearica TaxID=74829 RepID=UPI00190952DA|nr:type I restriction enzyme HsdR N-terminal domain-containing protein [Stutzerimonas balearica]
MKYSESDIRDKLISRLLGLDYPKSSIVLELGLKIGHTGEGRIDLAILDPDSNRILSIFEVKSDSKNIGGAVQQVLTYAKALPESILAFIYTLDENEEYIYSVDPKTNSVSQLYELPSFDSLKNSYSNPRKEWSEKARSKKTAARTWSNIVAGMSSSIAIAITIAMATGLFFSENKTLNNTELTSELQAIEDKNETLVKEIAQLQNELSRIKSGLSNISSLPEGHEWKTEASEIKHNMSLISGRLDALEGALTVNPSKALAVPILRKDLDNNEKNLKAELSQTRAEIDRMYDQNKWFIGLMFTIALSVLGMAASSFFNKKDT